MSPSRSPKRSSWRHKCARCVERDRLADRIALLESSIDDMTGAIKKQPAATAAELAAKTSPPARRPGYRGNCIVESANRERSTRRNGSAKCDGRSCTQGRCTGSCCGCASERN